MTSWQLGLLAAWSVLTWSGALRRWPWRVGGLEQSDLPQGGQRRRARRGLRRADAVRPPVRWSSRGRAARAVASDLVVAIDLLAVAVSAGHTIHTAVAAVGRRSTGPATAALGQVDAACGRGRPMAEALGELERALGPPARPLVTVLAGALRSGSPLAAALRRLADAERRRQRRAAETRVRRLPVLMLAPLVGLVLPAFLVLTIVPVAVTTARAGVLPASP